MAQFPMENNYGTQIAIISGVQFNAIPYSMTPWGEDLWLKRTKHQSI
jgi:hypothetical protein